MNYKLTIQYDGTDYAGWQIQPAARTIQSELTRVLSLLDHRAVTVYGAGRTDAGVHAEGQVANAFLDREFEPATLRDAINGNLDRDIRVVAAEAAPDSFNARFSASSKLYRYRVWNAPVASPFLHRYAYHYRGALDLDRMREAACALVGRHDFSAFTVKDSEAESHVRRLDRLDVEQCGNEVCILAEAEGFLRYMVRTIAGTLIEVGRSRIDCEAMPAILEGRDRAAAGPTAPAAGLTLVRVDY